MTATARAVPTPREAVQIQRELAPRVVCGGKPRVRSVCGVDSSVRDGFVSAALCVFTFPDLEPIETVTARRPVEFPYVPGLLSFREIPAVRDAWRRLTRRPDLLLVDGQGFAHPRRFGIASHLGVELARPSIGVAKTRLVGEHRSPGSRRGARTRLLHRDEVVGVVLRTRDGTAPVYVSIGHRIGLEEAVRLVLACTPRFRLPLPIRAADALAGRS